MLKTSITSLAIYIHSKLYHFVSCSNLFLTVCVCKRHGRNYLCKVFSWHTVKYPTHDFIFLCKARVYTKTNQVTSEIFHSVPLEIIA